MSSADRMIQGRVAPIEIDELLLLEEMSHRIKNEYAYIISAISLRAARSRNEDVKVALADAVELLMRFADVHRALMFPGHNGLVDVCAYLRQLCSVISHARLEDFNIRLILAESEPQFMTAERCWKLGLSVSELITNAGKHGLQAGNGEVYIELVNDEEKYVKCLIRDNGVRREQSSGGRGLRLVHSLVQSAGGTFQWAFGCRGTTSIIVLPRARGEADDMQIDDAIVRNDPISLVNL